MESDPGLQPLRAHVVSVLQELTAYQTSPGSKTASEATAEALRQLKSALANFVAITETKGCGTSDDSTHGSSECNLGNGFGSMSEVPLTLTVSAAPVRISPTNPAPREDWASSLFLRTPKKFWSLKVRTKRRTPGPVLSGTKRPPDSGAHLDDGSYGDIGLERNSESVQALLKVCHLSANIISVALPSASMRQEGLWQYHVGCVTIVDKVTKQGLLLE